MDLLIIRHGQSEADLLNMNEGRADFSLTQLGLRQAELMAEWVTANYQVGKLYSSPLRRASQTAMAIGKRANTQVIYDDDLMEFQNGLIAGMDRKEAQVKYPRPAVRRPHTLIYEMESDIQFRMRAETAFSKIIYENNPGETIAVVSHGGMINMLFQCFMQLPVSAEYYISSGDTGVHRWVINEKSRRIEFINSQVHLEPLQILT